MDQLKSKTALLNRTSVRMVLVLLALAAFVVAAGAPLCLSCP